MRAKPAYDCDAAQSIVGAFATGPSFMQSNKLFLCIMRDLDLQRPAQANAIILQHVF
jgi:hypothetical protein